MFSKGKMAGLYTAIALTTGLFASHSQAALLIEDAWNLNLSVVNGAASNGGGPVAAGLTNAVGIGSVALSGQSVVEQTVVGGSALGQSFTNNGILQLTSFTPEIFGPVQSFGLGNFRTIFITFEDLTGALNPDETITFDPFVGTIKLWLSDGDFDTTSDSIQLVEWDIVAPSGGSDLDFFGGGGANGTVDVTLEQVSIIDQGLFTNSGGDELGQFFLSLINVDTLLVSNLPNGNPDNSGVDGAGNGISVITVSNGGQFQLGTPQVVPIPTAVWLFGSALLGLAAVKRKKA